MMINDINHAVSSRFQNPNSSIFRPHIRVNTQRASRISNNFRHISRFNSTNNNRQSNRRERVWNSRRSHIQPRMTENLSQRELMIIQLNRGDYECLICVEFINQKSPLWTCANCFRCFHLNCAKRWANSSQIERTWKCPICSFEFHSDIQFIYKCFCGKVRNPTWTRHDSAHTCGNVCGKRLTLSEHSHESCTEGAEDRHIDACFHTCTLLCHPGPCPACNSAVERLCACGRIRMVVLCRSFSSFTVCGEVCDKLLTCSFHHCQRTCHSGACDPCQLQITLDCHCGRNSRTFVCGDADIVSDRSHHSTERSYSCGLVCGKLLSCGSHSCDTPCHPSSCSLCKFSPQTMEYCACGNTHISELPISAVSDISCDAKHADIARDVSSQQGGTSLVTRPPRLSCLDPPYTCSRVCNKQLVCTYHRCESQCHTGACAECPGALVTQTCTCGRTSREVLCTALCSDASGQLTFVCKTRCNVRMKCGKHRCRQFCCSALTADDPRHVCQRPCDRVLSCGLHQCERPCHPGACDVCHRTSFDELHCECGHSVLYPPIACGTAPPACTQICSREHPCGHEVTHTCHTDSSCPPCTSLVDRPCRCQRTILKNIPCYLDDVSCGHRCDKVLPCSHRCLVRCHSGACGTVCTQRCQQPRPGCAHVCGAPCHSGRDCPVDSVCQQPVEITCKCGLLKQSIKCFEFTANSDHATQRQPDAGTVDKRDVSCDLVVTQAEPAVSTSSMPNRTIANYLPATTISHQDNIYAILKCGDKCLSKAREQAFAQAFASMNISRPRVPDYPVCVRVMARNNTKFADYVHSSLVKLVRDLREASAHKKTHMFPSMSRAKREFIHEYCAYFGCTSESVDQEPNRSVRVTAHRLNNFIPSVSAVESNR